MEMSRRLIGLAVLAAALLAVVWVSPAGAHELVEFEKDATLAANGPIPPVPANPLEQVKEVCGSETAVFGSELLSGTPPSQIKVKNEWGDIIPDKDMMVSGKTYLENRRAVEQRQRGTHARAGGVPRGRRCPR
jgi:hypothetical protein